MHEKRAKSLYLFVVAYFLIILLRLFQLQVINGQMYQTKAETQRENMVKIQSERGLIFDRNGYRLAENQASYVLNFDKNLTNRQNPINREQINKMVSILLNDSNIFPPLTEEENTSFVKRKQNVEKYLTSLINDKKRRAGVIYKKIQSKTRINIEKLNIPIFFFTQENLRRYPEASSAAHILGYLGRDNRDELRGYFGVEGYYDLKLRGIDGFRIYEKDPLGRPIILNLYEKKDAVNGEDLKLTIDRSVQTILEKWLQWGVEKFDALGGNAILYDPINGEILALANYPAFDPNYYYLYSLAVLKNRAISDEFEPGSIMKPLIMAAALNENLITPSTRCPQCFGPREVSGYLIKTFDEQYKPNLSMTEVLERSDNTGMTWVGELLGTDKILKYFQNLGFGYQTGIDLEGEIGGYVKSKKSIYAIDQATMTFGQGITLTSVQMVRAWGALVTGRLVRPHVLMQNNILNISSQVYSSKTRETVKKMLLNVTDHSPLHFSRDRTPILKKYQIAAKSGTAQIAVAGKYAKDQTNGTVIGFAPVDKPKFILFVKLDRPLTDPWGANTAGPVFFNIINDLFLYYNIPPK